MLVSKRSSCVMCKDQPSTVTMHPSKPKVLQPWRSKKIWLLLLLVAGGFCTTAFGRYSMSIAIAMPSSFVNALIRSLRLNLSIYAKNNESPTLTSWRHYLGISRH